MFQYAYARSLQIFYGERKLYFDVTKLGQGHVRQYGLGYFCLNENVIIPNRFYQYASRLYVKILLNLFYRLLKISTVSEKGVWLFSKSGLYTNSAHYTFFPLVRSCVPVRFVRGFFQNEQYFDGIQNIIRREFTLKKLPVDEKVRKMYYEISNTESVCVHIRRGDFITNKKYNVCNEYYYQEGINYIQSLYPNAVFFVFSNSSEDIQWIKNNFSLKGALKYVDMNNSEIDDFYLMSKCRHFIISNSTFSWWAAYLSTNDIKEVVAPRPWVHSTENFEGIYGRDWKIIDITHEKSTSSDTCF